LSPRFGICDRITVRFAYKNDEDLGISKYTAVGRNAYMKRCG
jgi:hypothetical protein